MQTVIAALVTVAILLVATEAPAASLRDRILAALQNAPAPWVHSKAKREAAEARAKRLSIVADVIDSATARVTCTCGWEADNDCQPDWTRSRHELAAALVVIGQNESKFMGRIQEGKCRVLLSPPECDANPLLPPKQRVRKAKSYWQIQKTGLVRRGDWHRLDGSTSYYGTIYAAYTAARIYSVHYHRCRLGHRGAMSGYATGSGCGWPGSYGRAAALRRLLPKLHDSGST